MAEHRFTEEWLAQRLNARKEPVCAKCGQSAGFPRHALGECVLIPTTNPAPRKYRNTPTNGFDSAKESARYDELKLLAQVGAIRDLECQPRYDLIACNGEVIGRFTPDFRYFSVELGRLIVEDIKSPITKRETAYNLRKRLFEACHGIRLTEL